MLDAPQFLQTTSQPTAVIRFTIPRSEIQHVMGPGFGELMSTLAAQGIAAMGPFFSHHFRMDPQTFDFELGVPVPSPVTPMGRVTNSALPSVKVARTIYRGGYEGLGAAWGEFLALLDGQGHKSGPSLWECYRKGPESGPDSATWETELTRPLAE